MNYFFDTNAILIYLKDREKKDWLDKNYDPLGNENTAIISVVVLGELESISTPLDILVKKRKSDYL